MRVGGAVFVTVIYIYYRVLYYLVRMCGVRPDADGRTFNEIGPQPNVSNKVLTLKKITI